MKSVDTSMECWRESLRGESIMEVVHVLNSVALARQYLSV